MWQWFLIENVPTIYKNNTSYTICLRRRDGASLARVITKNSGVLAFETLLCLGGLRQKSDLQSARKTYKR